MSNNPNDNNDTQTTEISDTFVSHSDRQVESISFNDVAPFHKGLLQNISDGNQHDLKDFLSRPSLIYQGVWDMTVANTPKASLGAWPIPSSIITLIPTFSQKISGFLGFRATTVITLQVNATRFQQGRLLMTFFPRHEVSKHKYTTTYSSLMSMTQLPRVEFDVATDTEVTFRVPFIFDRLAYDTTSSYGNIGQVQLNVYSPLDCLTGETKIDYSVWAHFEDVELFFPTIPLSSLVPQSGGKSFRSRNFQAPSESESKTKGFISSNLNRVSRIADIVGEVPLFSSIAKPLSWVTSTAAHVASSFGFSNPLSATQSVHVVQKPFNRANNCSGLDNSYNMGLTEDNEVQHLPGFAGTDIDELSLDYVLGTPAWIGTYRWNDTDLVGANIYSVMLNPSMFTDDDPVGGGNFTIPMSYFATMFKQWRGGMKFKFKFVKTEFHSGRLMVTFVPGATSTSNPPVTPTNSSFLHREILDLRNTTEFEFIVPWACTMSYLPTSLGVAPFYTSQIAFSGRLDVQILNQLRAPSTVQPYLHMIVEVSAAPDFELAVPVGKGAYMADPYLIGTLENQSGDKGFLSRLENQGETSEGQIATSAKELTTTSGIGTARSVIDNSLDNAKYCVGEKVKSLRQLIKRATPWAKIINGGNGQYSYNYINPYTHYFNTYNTLGSMMVNRNNVPTIHSPAMKIDMLSRVAICYAYQRGSIRLKTYTDGADYRFSLYTEPEANYPQTQLYGVYYNTTNPPTNAMSLGNCTFMPTIRNINGPSEVQIPYYNGSYMHPVINDTGDPSANLIKSNYASQSMPKSMYLLSTRAQAATYYVQRQAGEDFDLGFFTGTPPVTSINSPGDAFQ